MQSPHKRYTVCHTVSVQNVGSLFKSKDILETTGFFSRFDPGHSFRLDLNFGSKEDEYLSAYCVPIQRGITITYHKYDVFDVVGKRLGGNNGVANWYAKSEETYGWGFHKLLNSVNDDITWNIVFKMEYEVPASTSKVSLPPSRLQQDYAKLLDSQEHADVKIAVQGEKMMAHKAVLAVRSSYFQRMFQTKMEESKSNEIEVTDVRPNVFKRLLKFLYGGVPPKYAETETSDLLIAADKYGVDELKAICESLLSSHLTSDNVIEALLLAESHNCSNLMMDATTVFKMHSDELRNSKEWERLKSSPDLLLKLLHAFCEK